MAVPRRCHGGVTDVSPWRHGCVAVASRTCPCGVADVSRRRTTAPHRITLSECTAECANNSIDIYIIIILTMLNITCRTGTAMVIGARTELFRTDSRCVLGAVGWI